MSFKKRFIHKLILLLVGPVYGLISRLLFSTCRVGYVDRKYLVDLEKSGQPFIASFWHYGVFYIVHQSRGKKWVSMISSSKDGDYLTRVLEGLGYEVVRGSRHRGGIGALKGMVEAVSERGLNAATAADGSQGPARVAQAGVILLASKTGAPILPVGWAADRYLSFRSWDRTALPKPFARIEMRYGAPITVPAGIKAKDIEPYRLQLDERLNEIYKKSWGSFGVSEH
ncbi:MAG: lysophospholipid acyltransferase family protein [Proteobacteria bacterium]|nr:lysophospholipid acyltransferase family protein [Pseudomonadota bacterium]MBU1714157.1 lysophospholipid acyltransferase family protein [Pseudomonadota bacterium]